MKIAQLTFCLLFQIIACVNAQLTICCYWNCYSYIPYQVEFHNAASEIPQIQQEVEYSTTNEPNVLGNIFDAPLVCASGQQFVGGRCRKVYEF